MTKRIIGVDKEERIAYLACGHTKVWPVRFMHHVNLPLPKAGQITECGKCAEAAPRDPIPLTVCRRPNAEWGF
jgi:hypothetical protein